MPSSPESLSFRRHTETLLLLAALTLVAYASSFAAGFAFDNAQLILRDPRVHAVSLHNLKDILLRDYWWGRFNSGLYRPLTTLSFLLNYAVLGGHDNPLGYHCVNLLLHALNAFLVYLLALHLVRQYWPAFFAAALWALHPISTEAVTNIIGRADELAALGVLGALLFYVSSAQETGLRRIPWLAGASLLTTLAVFSKENGVVVLGLVLLYDFTWRVSRGSSIRAAAVQMRQFFWQGYLYLVLPILVMLGARWEVLRHSGPTDLAYLENPLLGADFPTRCAMALRVAGKYLWLLVWPKELSADYSYNQVPLLGWHSATWRDAAAAAALLVLVLLAAWSYRRSRIAYFLVGFTALALLPASNLVVTAGTVMAERLLYLPSVAFATALAIGAYQLAHKVGLRPVAAALLLSAIGVAYGVRTYTRNFDWRNDETLFTSAVEAAPASFKAHMALADALLAADPLFAEGERAIEEAEKGAAIVSDVPDDRNATKIFTRLAAVYFARGDSLARRDAAGNPIPDTASLVWYQKSLAAGRRGQAVDRLLPENHQSPDLQRILGFTCLRLGDPATAVQEFLVERRLTPRLPDSYAHLAAAYLAQNQSEEAATAMLESLLLAGSPSTLDGIAQVYAGVDGGGCALAIHGGGRSLNRDCAVVRRDLCSGYLELEQVFQEAKLSADVERFRDARLAVPDCR